MARNKEQARMPIVRDGKIIFLRLYQYLDDITFEEIMNHLLSTTKIYTFNFKNQLYYITNKCLICNNKVIFYEIDKVMIINDSKNKLITELWKGILMYANYQGHSMGIKNEVDMRFFPNTHNTNIDSENLNKYLKAAIALI